MQHRRSVISPYIPTDFREDDPYCSNGEKSPAADAPAFSRPSIPRLSLAPRVRVRQSRRERLNGGILIYASAAIEIFPFGAALLYLRERSTPRSALAPSEGRRSPNVRWISSRAEGKEWYLAPVPVHFSFYLRTCPTPRRLLYTDRSTPLFPRFRLFFHIPTVIVVSV